jgi:hypothetical protein
MSRKEFASVGLIRYIPRRLSSVERELDATV